MKTKWVREIAVERRKPVEMPAEIAKLLKAAGLESHSPEVALGLMFGCIAHLGVAVWEQWPQAWPIFSDAIRRSSAELDRLASSASPRIALDAIMASQRQKSAGTTEA